MITIGMNYEIIPGKEELFESVFAKVMQVMQGLDGHVRSRLFIDTANKSSYMILSEWSDRKKFDAFIASEQFRNVANWGKEQVLATRPTHQYYGDAGEQGAKSGGCPMSSH